MPVTNENNTIILKPVEAIGQYEEGRVAASTSIKPGMLIELTSADRLKPHATAGGAGECLISIEDGLGGGITAGLGPTIDTAVAAGGLVRYVKPKPGDEALVRIPAGAAAIVIGDDLVSNGDGTFKKTASGSNTVFGQAREAIDNSAGSDQAWVKIRFQGN